MLLPLGSSVQVRESESVVDSGPPFSALRFQGVRVLNAFIFA